MAKRIIIAIDGPAASGKSTTARQVASRLGYLYVDTGAMYRAVAWLFMNQGLKPATVTDEEIAALLLSTPVRLKQTGETLLVFAGDHDITEAIRLPEISRAVSAVSALRAVRKEMVRLQQEMGLNRGLVMDGRDIGTVVFPDAELKIFMIADAKSRAKRRQLELEGKGQSVRFEDLLQEIENRDYADSHRDEAPLRAAADAIHLDTSNLSIDEQVQEVLNRARPVIG